MKKAINVLRTLFLFFMICLSMNVKAFAFSGKGSGTAEDPYQISTAEQLKEISSNLSATYKLVARIDLESVDWVPLGNKVAPFKGRFFGNGYSILNLEAKKMEMDYVGLFGYADSANFSDIRISNVNITGRDNVGGLVGYIKKGTVDNCSITGNGLIQGSSNVGGLVGSKEYGTVSLSNTNIEVRGTTLSTGGLIGDNTGDVRGSYSCGNNISGATNVGGLIGYTHGSDELISKCYSYSNVTGIGTATRIGGLIGRIGSPGVKVENCLVLGDITGSSYCGGIVGYNSVSPTVTKKNLFYAGKITGNTNLGGIIANSTSDVASSFFDSTKAGLSTPTSQARATGELRNGSLYQGWDFENTWYFDDIWPYPCLDIHDFQNNNYLKGDGSKKRPFEITSAEDFKMMEDFSRGTYYKLVKNIDFEYDNWAPIDYFDGVFDGNGYIMSNLQINLPNENNIGFFRDSDSGVFKNIILKNIEVTGDHNVGALLGHCGYSTIENCSVIGDDKITGTWNVGGLVGYANKTTITDSNTSVDVSGNGCVGGLVGYGGNHAIDIQKSYTKGNVTGKDSVGGLVGQIWSDRFQTISECYSTGIIKGISSVGGLLGAAGGEEVYRSTTILDCFTRGYIMGDEECGGFIGTTYGDKDSIHIKNGLCASYIYIKGKQISNGFVGKITNIVKFTNSYFDKETTGCSAPPELALSTSQLKSKETFATWDFGLVWNINKSSYPYLRRADSLPTHTVRFEVNNGSLIEAQEVQAGVRATKPTDPTRVGYTFGGWYTAPECITEFDFNTAAINADITIFAKWTTSVFSVVFDTVGGTTVPAQAINIGGKATKPADPTRAGYTFAGWYTSNSYTTAFDFSTVAISTATTIYAKWNIITFNVAFETAGGTTVPAQTINMGEKVTKPADPTRVGYTFTGWYTSNIYTTVFDFNTVTINVATTIYAKWNIISCSVAFDTAGGTTVPTQTINMGGKVTRPADPTRTGYTFAGWYTSNSYTTVFDFNTVTINATTTIYAKWNIITYSVAFDTAGGNTLPTQTINMGGKVTRPADPTRTGYTFAGWYTSNSYTTAFDFNTVTINATTTIYAKWNVNIPNTTIAINAVAGNTYSVVFSSMNTSAVNSRIFTATYDATKFDLVDFAGQTQKLDTAVGRIEDTDLEILSISNGVIKFKYLKTIDNQTALNGALTIIQLKAKTNGSSVVKFEL